MELLSITQSIIKNLKKYPHPLKLEILDLAKRSVEFDEEIARKAEALESQNASIMVAGDPSEPQPMLEAAQG